MVWGKDRFFISMSRVNIGSILAVSLYYVISGCDETYFNIEEGELWVTDELFDRFDGDRLKVNMMEELDRVKEENSAMKRMLSEMQAQNAALLQRMSALETQK